MRDIKLIDYIFVYFSIHNERVVQPILEHDILLTEYKCTFVWQGTNDPY